MKKNPAFKLVIIKVDQSFWLKQDGGEAKGYVTIKTSKGEFGQPVWFGQLWSYVMSETLNFFNVTKEREPSWQGTAKKEQPI